MSSLKDTGTTWDAHDSFPMASSKQKTYGTVLKDSSENGKSDPDPLNALWPEQ